ncbi:hypothetical protein [Arthrobacter sp. 35W]|uniref:hypothetical protein n=1 Tax=Arthrobacter sp. 35W TaxID=1132441 RepID=UPI00040AB5DD|nr:hypothetical protein [Arthrobacter sp. 35W]
MSSHSIVAPLVKAPMLALGFRKRAGLIFTMEVAPGFLGWVSIATRAQYMSEPRWAGQPNIAVRHQEVSRIAAQLAGREYHPYHVPQIGNPLRYLTPHRGNPLQWEMGTFPGADLNAQDMVDAIRDYGLPFIRKYATNEAMLSAMAQNLVLNSGVSSRSKPVLLALMGRFNEATDNMDSLVASAAGIDLPWAENDRSYAANFHTWLAERAAGQDGQDS